MNSNCRNPLFRSAFPLLLLACAVPVMYAQAYTPPPPPLTTAPCVPTKKDPCTPPPAAPAVPSDKADPLAFPGDSKDVGTLPLPSQTDDYNGTVPPPAKPVAPMPPSAPTPASGSSSSGSQSPAAPADKFAFPGEDSTPGSSSSSSSSSSSAGSSDASADDADKPALKDEGSEGSTRASRRHLPKVEDPNEREAKDLEVAHYYFTTGNYLASLNRAKDAVRLFPDDPEAHFALALAAQNMKNKEQAVAEYQAYLKLDPDGDHAKDAQKALREVLK